MGNATLICYCNSQQSPTLITLPVTLNQYYTNALGTNNHTLTLNSALGQKNPQLISIQLKNLNYFSNIQIII